MSGRDDPRRGRWPSLPHLQLSKLLPDHRKQRHHASPPRLGRVDDELSTRDVGPHGRERLLRTQTDIRQ